MTRLYLAVVLTAAFLIAGCAGRFETTYPEPVDPAVSRGWTVVAVRTVVPDRLRVSEDNVLVPDADIVWHSEPEGDRRAQVAAIVTEGVEQGAAPLDGPRRVVFYIQLRRFHGVTPAAINSSPGGVHNISYRIWVLDARSSATILGPVPVEAALIANTGANAIVAAETGVTERARIVEHIAATTAGWLGIGPDARDSFVSIGR
jgi:hypothetical protein